MNQVFFRLDVNLKSKFRGRKMSLTVTKKHNQLPVMATITVVIPFRTDRSTNRNQNQVFI